MVSPKLNCIKKEMKIWKKNKCTKKNQFYKNIYKNKKIVERKHVQLSKNMFEYDREE